MSNFQVCAKTEKASKKSGRTVWAEQIYFFWLLSPGAWLDYRVQLKPGSYANGKEKSSCDRNAQNRHIQSPSLTLS